MNTVFTTSVKHYRTTLNIIEYIAVNLLSGCIVVKIYSVFCSCRHICKEIVAYQIISVPDKVIGIYRTEILSRHHHVVEHIVFDNVVDSSEGNRTVSSVFENIVRYNRSHTCYTKGMRR